MSVADSSTWLQSRGYQQQLDVASSVDFTKLFGHAFARDADQKALVELTALHRASIATVRYVQLFATLYQRIKDAKGKIRSRGTPLLFVVPRQTESEKLAAVVVLSMRERLQYNAHLLCENKAVDSDRDKLAAALHAGFSCEAAYKGIAQSLIAACTNESGAKQLHTARHCFVIGCLDGAAQHLVRHYVFYGDWGRAAGVCEWYRGHFVTAGLPDWMTEVVEDNTAIHKQAVIVFSGRDQIRDAIFNGKTEAGAYVTIETIAGSPVLRDLFV